MARVYNTVVIIIAAGDATRWGNYTGVPKNLLEIEGEKLIHRTVRLVNKYNPKATVYVVSKDGEFEVPGAIGYKAKLNPENKGADKFLSSKELWNRNGRTIVLYGDVWFSDEAMQKILNWPSLGWTLFARFGPSRWTRCPWGECFAQSFYSDDIAWHENMLQIMLSDIRRGVIKDGGGWEHYCLMHGFPYSQRQVGERLVQIDDFTDDFDFPQDYEHWLDARREWKETGYVKPNTAEHFTFCAVYHNEATKVRYGLDVVKHLCSDIVIAVQDSDDKTDEVCRRYTSHVLNHPHQSPEESKDEIMENVNTEWTLWLDADETLSLPLIRFIESFDPDLYKNYDAIRIPRINYINGQVVEANEGTDKQFRIIRKTVRWEPKKQGQRIHIHPLVKNPFDVSYPIFHHRTLEKIEMTTKRWNELEPKTVEPCNRYLERVKQVLSNS